MVAAARLCGPMDREERDEPERKPAQGLAAYLWQTLFMAMQALPQALPFLH